MRNNVAAVVRAAAGGDRIVITVDGAPVAMLGPLEPGDGASLEDLIAAGLVEPPGRRDRPEAPAASAVPVDIRLSRALDEVRG